MQVLAQLKYQKIREIGVGQGLNSKVYLAHDEQFGGNIAVKEIPKSLLGRAGIANIFNEAQVMFAAQHPQNIVPIHYAGEIPNADAICIAMPYYKHGSLQDRIANGPIDLLESIRVGLAILTGLGSIHAKNFRHFDIKPSNILFGNRDEPMLADFGQTRAAATAGKAPLPPMYRGGMPPEFYGSGIGGVETDVYHVGLTLYRIVNGDPFFKTQQPIDESDRKARTLAGKLPNRGKFREHVPSRLRRVICKALRVNHLERYSSASDMANALASCDIENNWTTVCNGNGEINWSCTRDDGRPGLAVELAKNGKLWDVSAFTVGAKQRRRNDLCLTKAKLADAQRHLRTVFEQLG